MNNIIGINLLGNAKVYWNSDELAEWLRKQAWNTRPFLDAISKFLEEFNKKFNTEVTFEQVLDIYDKKKNKLGKNQSIVLCKALLEFIQNNWIYVTFHGKSHLLKYSTLAWVNITLECNSPSINEMQTLHTLSITISSFIEKIRDYFRMLIPDWVTLQEADVINDFINVPWINVVKNTEKVDSDEQKENLEVAPKSLKISDSLAFQLDVSDEDLKQRISILDNKWLIELFEYIHRRLPLSKKTSEIQTNLAKFLFNGYKPHFSQTIKKVLNWETQLRSDSIEKINIRKLKEFLFSGRVDWIDVNEDFVNLSWNTLYVSQWVDMDLTSDSVFSDNLTNLLSGDVQKLFSYLEDLVRKNKNIKWTTAQKLATIIHKSKDKKLSISQKVTTLRTKKSKITQKFISSNINISALRELILSSIWTDKWVDTWTEPGEWIEKPKGTFEFKFVDDGAEKPNGTFEFKLEDEEWDKWNNQVSINVELNWKNGLEGFIYSLNSLITQRCKDMDLIDLIEPFKIENFEWIWLNTAFFDNVNRVIEWDNILYMFEIFGQDVLENFLVEWHKKVWKKLKESKKVIIVPGSKEEVLDFAFNVLQNAINKKADKIVRKSRRDFHNMGQKRLEVRLTEEMFAWIDKLTINLLSKVNLPQAIFSLIPKEEINNMLRKYLAERKKVK